MLRVRLVLLLAAMRVRVLCECVWIVPLQQARLCAAMCLPQDTHRCIPCQIIMGSLVDKTFMGRVFLPPAPSAELHINIGWNVRNGQRYAEWMPVFQEAISQKDYEELVSKLKDYLETNAINPYLPICAQMTCVCGVGCCICGYLYVTASSITRDLKKIAEEYPGARVELFQMTTPTALTADAMGFDQYGQPPQQVFGAGEHSAGEMKPCWPPLGYNIILKATQTSDLRSVWPKSLATGSMLPVVMQVSMDRVLLP